MKVARDDIRRRYASMSSAQLSLIKRAELTDVGRECYDFEVARRMSAPSTAVDRPRASSSPPIDPRLWALAGLLIFGTTYFGITAYKYHATSDAFGEAQLAHYLNAATRAKLDSGKGNRSTKSEASPKVVIITAGGHLHKAHMELSESLRANEPTEVRTIALVGDCSDLDWGTYQNGAKSTQERCSVIVVNASSGRIVADGFVVAPNPPYSTSSASGVFMKVEPAKIAEWVSSVVE